jgi:hypothetical protein
MTKIRRQVWGKTIYRLWFEYLKQLEVRPSEKWWLSKYKDWDLHEVSVIDKKKGTVNQEEFDIWWDSHWETLFSDTEEVFSGDTDGYTGVVQEITGSSDFSDDNFIYVRIEIPPKEHSNRGSNTVKYHKMIQDKVKTILKDKSRRPPYRFPISSKRVDLPRVQDRLELLIVQTKLNEVLKNRNESVELKKETELLTDNVSYLSGDIDEKSKRKRILRETERLENTLENISMGTFP